MYYNAKSYNFKELKGTEFYNSRAENLDSVEELQEFGVKVSKMNMTNMKVDAYDDGGYKGTKIYTLNPSTETWDLV